MVQNIKILKLLTGEEIIAEVLDNGSALGGDKTKVRIRNPFAVVVLHTRTDPNRIGDRKTPTVGFAPWPQFTDEKIFTLDMHHVVAIMEPIKEFLTQYSSMINGIVLPANKIMLPGVS